MFGLFGPRTAAKTADARDVQKRLAAGEIHLVDVREPWEFRSERIKGAINVPLSRLAEEATKIPRDKPVILHCLSGGRSQRALGLCAKLGLPVDTHMTGGISAWKASGLPVER